MKHFRTVHFYVSALFFFLHQPAVAQITESTYEIGINAGTFIYQGDLTPSAAGSFKTPGWVIAINGSRRITDAFSVRLDLNVGKLKGDDAKYAAPEWRQQRNLAFKSAVTELAALLVWHPLGQDRKFSPYLFGGVGYAFVNIKRDYSAYNAAYFGAESLDERLADDIAHSLPKGLPVVPIGIGVKYTLTPKWSLQAESGYRHLFTDYLDGFSQAGNPSKGDHYQKISVGISYKFGGKNRYGCPVVKF